ncbi:amidohydrolase family protein [uncultured Williamsia sp.]|uniref:amidohydrolase family protein n=1 Tax=uncultured Williamsia sp. TaxID=259311 RepID=UPI00260CA81E|nr:amidohydrolase family protein [uncultured Williamsia sp.]
MPLQPSMKLVSVDDHLIEPPHVWTDRLPSKYREIGPHIEEFPRGEGKLPVNMWVYEGRTYPNIGLNAVAGKPPEEFGVDPVRYDEMIPGCYEPKARLADMDIDGVHAMLCFPSFPRFCGTVFLEGEDKELSLLSVKAWNDFSLDEWCATDPARFIPMGILPLWDAQLMVAEIERLAAMGCRAIGLPDNPSNLKLPSYHTTYWDPVFSALEETNMTVVMHFGSGGLPPQTSPEAPFAVWITLMGTTSMACAIELVFSPVFHKHPNLKVAFSEGGIGWMPYLVERADYVWRKHKYYQNIHPTVPPSELFKRNIAGCFIEDEVGMKLRDSVGIDNITWECDYPHSDSFWPKSRARAEEQLKNVPDEDAAKIVELNARKWYAFPEEGFKSCTADTGWRPNDGKPSEYDYDEVMATAGGVGIKGFMDNIADQMSKKN